MPDAGGAMLNVVWDDRTTGPVTLKSYVPGKSVEGSLIARDQAPALAANSLLSDVFLAPRFVPEIVSVAGAPTVPATVIELLLSLPDFHVRLILGFATVVAG